MQTKMTALTISGKNSRVVSKEVFNAYYELTREGPSPRNITKEETDLFLNSAPDDYTLSYLTSLLADIASGNGSTKTKKCRFNAWDRITIPENYFYQKQPEIKTTVGRFIMNKAVLEGSGCIAAVKVVDSVLNKKGLEKVDDLVGDLYLNDFISRDNFNRYIDRRDTLGYWLNGMLAHTLSEKMAHPLEAVERKKKELLKKYEKELEAHDIDVMTKISDELVAYAREILKDDPGMNLYLSGDLDFANNYKNNSILKGPVMNKITGEYDFVGSSFMDGIEVKDIPAHANSILSAQYPASIGTQDAGYVTKKLIALLQMANIDEPGTDCGTKNLIPVTITGKNKNDMVYSYIQQGTSLTLLTPENIGSYVGKTVMMRSPMTCCNDLICSKCAGELFYKLGIRNAGLYSVQLSHAQLNLSLKAKHIQVVDLYRINPEEMVVDL